MMIHSTRLLKSWIASFTGPKASCRPMPQACGAPTTSSAAAGPAQKARHSAAMPSSPVSTGAEILSERPIKRRIPCPVRAPCARRLMPVPPARMAAPTGRMTRPRPRMPGVRRRGRTIVALHHTAQVSPPRDTQVRV